MSSLSCFDLIEELVPSFLQEKCGEVAKHFIQTSKGKVNRAAVPVIIALLIGVACVWMFSPPGPHNYLVFAFCFLVYFAISRPLRRKYERMRIKDFHDKAAQDPEFQQAYDFINENRLLRHSIFS